MIDFKFYSFIVSNYVALKIEMFEFSKVINKSERFNFMSKILILKFINFKA
jgi:hypothetical protein